MGAKERNYDVVKISGTTTSGGAATVDSETVTGIVLAVWVDGTNLTNGADLDINAVYTDVDGTEILGEDIINNEDAGNAALNQWYPRKFAQDVAGADIEVATSVKTVVPYAVFEAPLRVTVASGGTSVAFAVRILMEL